MYSKRIYIIFQFIFIFSLTNLALGNEQCTDYNRWRAPFTLTDGKGNPKWNLNEVEKMVHGYGMSDAALRWGKAALFGAAGVYYESQKTHNVPYSFIPKACQALIAQIALKETDEYLRNQRKYCKEDPSLRHLCADSKADLNKEYDEYRDVMNELEDLVDDMEDDLGELPPMQRHTTTDENGGELVYYDFDCSSSSWCTPQLNSLNSPEQVMRKSTSEARRQTTVALDALSDKTPRRTGCKDSSVRAIQVDLAEALPEGTPDAVRFRAMCESDAIKKQYESYGYQMFEDKGTLRKFTEAGMTKAVDLSGYALDTGIPGLVARNEGAGWGDTEYIDGHMDSLKRQQKIDTMTNFRQTILKNQWRYMDQEQRQKAQGKLNELGLQNHTDFAINAPIASESQRGTGDHMQYFNEIANLDPKSPNQFIPYMSSDLLKEHVAGFNGSGQNPIAEAAKFCIVLDKVDNIDEMGLMARDMAIGIGATIALEAVVVASFGTSWVATAAVGFGVDMVLISEPYFDAKEDYEEALEKSHLHSDEHIEEMRVRMEEHQQAAVIGGILSLIFNGATGGAGAVARRLIPDDIIKQMAKLMVSKGSDAMLDFLRKQVSNGRIPKEAIELIGTFLNKLNVDSNMDEILTAWKGQIKKLNVDITEAESTFKAMLAFFKNPSADAGTAVAKGTARTSSARIAGQVSSDGAQAATGRAGASTVARTSASQAAQDLEARAAARMARSKYPVAQVMDNAGLDDAARVSAAARATGKNTLTETQSQALLRAHNHGDGSVFRYTDEVLQEKYNILRRGGFSEDEAKDLMRRGLAGKTATTTIHPNAVQRTRIIQQMREENSGTIKQLVEMGKKRVEEIKEQINNLKWYQSGRKKELTRALNDMQLNVDTMNDILSSRRARPVATSSRARPTTPRRTSPKTSSTKRASSSGDDMPIRMATNNRTINECYEELLASSSPALRARYERVWAQLSPEGKRLLEKLVQGVPDERAVATLTSKLNQTDEILSSLRRTIGDPSEKWRVMAATPEDAKNFDLQFNSRNPARSRPRYITHKTRNGTKIQVDERALKKAREWVEQVGQNNTLEIHGSFTFKKQNGKIIIDDFIPESSVAGSPAYLPSGGEFYLQTSSNLSGANGLDPLRYLYADSGVDKKYFGSLRSKSQSQSGTLSFHSHPDGYGGPSQPDLDHTKGLPSLVLELNRGIINIVDDGPLGKFVSQISW
ncbi:MAG: hypothetical protein ABIA04_07515 [Pseudomonadota bacterium]